VPTPFSSIGVNLRRISMKKKETLNFRVSTEFKRRLTEEAKKERRSLTNYLEVTLTKLWEQQESAKTRRRQVT
jgi:predicted HicB family RNase H-like nuclease